MADNMAINKNTRTKMSKGERLNRISLSTNTILASQAKKAKETRKNKRYCLLNSNASKLKGRKNRGIKKTNAYILVLIILLYIFLLIIIYYNLFYTNLQLLRLTVNKLFKFILNILFKISRISRIIILQNLLDITLRKFRIKLGICLQNIFFKN